MDITRGTRRQIWKKRETVFAKRPLETDVIPILDYFLKKKEQFYVDAICITLFNTITTFNTDFLKENFRSVYSVENQRVKKTLGYAVASPLGIIWKRYMSEEARLEIDTNKLDKFLYAIENFDLRTFKEEERDIHVPDMETDLDNLEFKQRKELTIFKETQADELDNFVKNQKERLKDFMNRQQIERDVFVENFSITQEEAEEAKQKNTMAMDSYEENWAVWKSRFN
jgi:hypothetical protein